MRQQPLAGPADHRFLAAEDRSAEWSATRWDKNPRRYLLGPQPTAKQRTTTGRSGRRTFAETAGRAAYSLLTSGGGDGRRGARVPHHPTAASPSGSYPRDGGH